MRCPEAAAPLGTGIYFAVLTLALGLAEPSGLLTLPILFLLKDELGLQPHGIAVFEAIVLVPVYFGFAFGFLRDRWRPFGRDDRSWFLLAVPVAMASYGWLAVGTLSWSRLIAAMLVATIAFECLGAAAEGLMTAAAQRSLMTGRLSALAEMAEIVPSVIAMLLGGWLVAHVTTRASLLLAAVLTSMLLLLALWRPTAVFEGSSSERPAENHRQALRRLLRHPPLWPSIAVLLLWNFSPGWGTPLLFFLSDDVAISAVAFGAFRAALLASGAVATLVYAVLCRRFPLRTILWVALAVNIPPGFLLLLIGSGAQAVAIAAGVGLLLGMANIALFDLLRRACPPHLESTGTMLGYSVFAVGGTLGDLLGALLYEAGGFMLCLATDALANGAILLLLLRVPPMVLATRDGEAGEPAATVLEPVLATS